MAEATDEISLLASRICHDLVSPVGAIVNGTDLIREIGIGDVQDEVAMISQSASRAAALLQFYRIAFGAVADADAALSRTMLQDQAVQMLKSPKVSLEWEGVAGPAMTRSESRFLFQLLMCARAIAGMRAQILVRLDLEASFPISIVILPLQGAVGPGTVNHDALNLLAVRPGRDDVTARQIEFALVHASATALGVRLNVSMQGDGAHIQAVRA